MPDDLAQLKTIRSQTLARISEITAAPKPSYAIDGQQVAWADYLKTLQHTLAWCDEQMASQQPFEEHTQAVP